MSRAAKSMMKKERTQAIKMIVVVLMVVSLVIIPVSMLMFIVSLNFFKFRITILIATSR